MIAGGQLLAAPCIIAVLLAPTPEQSYGLLFLAYLTAETWLGPAAAVVQVRTIHNTRTLSIKRTSWTTIEL